ncbi:unnamed protein product, partial [Prorocentrum cordatum]
VRVIDDFSASLINECTAPTERIRMETLDVLVSLARALRGRGPLMLRKEDFARAFKTLPLALSALCMAVAVWGEAAQEGWALQLWRCPFGAVASAYAILGRLFFAPTGRFADDLFGIDPEGGWAEGPLAGAAGASRATRFVIETLLGWKQDEEKRVSSAESAEVLGATVTVINKP